MTSKRERIGLTGARGVLGRSLQRDCPDVEWVLFPGDIRELPMVKKWLTEAGPLDGVVHLAAIVPTVKVEANPAEAIRANVEGTVNILDAARGLVSQPWVFLASSSHVYASSAEPLSEDSLLSPVSLYGLTKRQAEDWALTYQQKFNLPVCVGRIFSFSSPWQDGSYFIPGLIRKISEAPRGAKLEIFGLHGTRDFLSTEQISAVIKFLFTKRAAGIFNIGSGQSVRLLDVALEVQRRLGRDDVQIIPLEKGTAHLNAKVDKLKGLGLQSHFDLAAFLDPMLPGR